MADAPQFRTLSAHGGAGFEAGRLGGPRGEQLRMLTSTMAESTFLAAAAAIFRQLVEGSQRLRKQ